MPVTQPQTVLVTGGAGYVGSALVPKLLAAGHRVRVLDLYLFGADVLAPCRGPALHEIRADLRDPHALRAALAGCDAVVHLACVSNDPSFELDPALGRSINYGAFLSLVDLARQSGIRRFVYASTSSVYGVKQEEEVTEELPLEPLTDYSRYKAMCEQALLAEPWPGCTVVIVRPATVCGYAPRLRLDLIVNILANQAVSAGRITVLGGGQKRPNIHVDDITDLYVELLDVAHERVDRETFNAGYGNHTVLELAELVRRVVVESGLRREVEIEVATTNDVRSYHVSSEKIRRVLGFEPRRSIEDGVRDLCVAFAEGRIPDPLSDPRYYNIRTMQAWLHAGALLAEGTSR